MRSKFVAVFTIAGMLTSSVLLAGGAPAISVNLIRCAAPNIHPRVTATVQPDAVTGRVYFKAFGQANEYYVDMTKSGADSMTALLPMPSADTHVFSYRVVTMDKAGKWTSSAQASTDVREFCDTGDKTAALVLGLTSPAQSSVPDGFQCTNVVRYVTSAGMLMNNDECRRILAGVQPLTTTPAATAATTGTTAATTGTTAGSAAATGAGTTAAATTAGTTAVATEAAVAAGGLSAATIAALTILGLGAGYAIYRNTQDDNEPVSASRP